MTKINLAEIEAAARAATPGPWAVKEDECNGKEEAWCAWHRVGALSMMGRDLNKDTRFIAAANPATKMKP